MKYYRKICDLAASGLTGRTTVINIRPFNPAGLWHFEINWPLTWTHSHLCVQKEDSVMSLSFKSRVGILIMIWRPRYRDGSVEPPQCNASMSLFLAMWVPLRNWASGMREFPVWICELTFWFSSLRLRSHLLVCCWCLLGGHSAGMFSSFSCNWGILIC